jgi:ABC-2 type transport system ATP-binding protein
LLLTTQYLEEADQLADDIAVIDHGRVIARGPADELKTQVGGDRLEVTVAPEDLENTSHVLSRVANAEAIVDHVMNRVSVAVTAGSAVLPEVVRNLDADHIKIVDLALKRPSLDDVFMSLTGHAAEVVEEESPAGGRA